MNLTEIFATTKFCLSFEVFPPKTAEGDAALSRALDQLCEYQPGFVSCTYGAGGSTSKRTLEWCRTIQSRHSKVAMAHFTCLGAERDEMLDWLRQARKCGIQNIMALRGDRPQVSQDQRGTTAGFQYASQVVQLICEHFPEMGIGVAGYPETHPEATSKAADLQHLVDKIGKGADAVFTQIFFNNSHFFRFRDQLTARGVTIPVIPGIMPITDYDQIVRITSMCGTTIPELLRSRLEAARGDREAQFEIGVEFAIEQCQELLREGVPGLHFYVLNKAAACLRIVPELAGAGLASET